MRSAKSWISSKYPDWFNFLTNWKMNWNYPYYFLMLVSCHCSTFSHLAMSICISAEYNFFDSFLKHFLLNLHMCHFHWIHNPFRLFKHWCTCYSLFSKHTWQLTITFCHQILHYSVPAQESSWLMPFWKLNCGKTANTCNFHHQVSDIYCSFWNNY